MPAIEYSAENFPEGWLPSGHQLDASIDDLVWAAVTVGRESWANVFQHGIFSMHEAIFRWSIVRMALAECLGRFTRSPAAQALDPTEKAAVNYFLGMAVCKLFAERLLNTTWLLHIDVFRSARRIEISPGRSRPDLVGQQHDLGPWHSFECKGLGAPPSATTRARAKLQASRAISVGGIACSLRIGAITYFRSNGELRFYWCDPPPEAKAPIDLDPVPEIWKYYFNPLVELVTEEKDRKKLEEVENFMIRVPASDLEFGIHPAVAGYLFRQEWNLARKAAVKEAETIRQAGYQRDGLVVRVGSSWKNPMGNDERQLQSKTI